jgi:hypothetical protein
VIIKGRNVFKILSLVMKHWCIITTQRSKAVDGILAQQFFQSKKGAHWENKCDDDILGCKNHNP